MSDLLNEVHAEAICLGDEDLFLVPENDSRFDNQRAAARAICEKCPVQQKCLEWALHNKEPYGIWGGTTPSERSKLRLDRKA